LQPAASQQSRHHVKEVIHTLIASLRQPTAIRGQPGYCLIK
jgi:hypothetical protein